MSIDEQSATIVEMAAMQFNALKTKNGRNTFEKALGVDSENCRTLKTIASKYGLSSISEQLDAADNAEAMRIVFLGEFSSGKSSLINKLLSTKLPVGTKPTTKAVCIIRPSLESDARTCYFRLLPDGAMQEIEWMDFDESVQSDGIAETLVVEVPHSDFLKKGTIIVDTPGEGSLSAESTITQSYLAQVDAAVFCISAADGTLHDHVRSFIGASALRRAHVRMVFAITMSDLKAKTLSDGRREIDVVKEEIIDCLKELAAKGVFCAGDIEDRVVCVSAAESSNNSGVDDLLKALQKFIFGKDGDVAAERKAETCRALATSAAAMLEERVETMSLDVDGFRQKMGAVEDERKAGYAKLDELKNQFDKFRRLLPEGIGNAFDGRMPELVHAETPEEVVAVSQSLASDITETVSRLAKVQLGQQQWTIDHSFDSQIRAALPAALVRIDKTAKAMADVAFIALSGGVAAALPGGAAAAGGAARGGAAVLTRTAGTSVAKNVTTWAKVIGKGAAVLSKIMDSLNPVSYIGDWAVPGIKEKVLLGFRERLVVQADTMADMIWEEYDGLVLRPVRQSLDERIAAVNKVREEIESSKRDFTRERHAIEEDIRILKSMA